MRDPPRAGRGCTSWPLYTERANLVATLLQAGLAARVAAAVLGFLGKAEAPPGDGIRHMLVWSVTWRLAARGKAKPRWRAWRRAFFVPRSGSLRGRAVRGLVGRVAPNGLR